MELEYLINPLGIDIIHPHLTWNIIGDDINNQIAFEITYKINGGEEKIINKETSSVCYEFEEELKSRDFVSWKIRVKNEKDIWSKYSKESYFSIGLLNKNDWSAKWIFGDYSVSKKQRYPVDYFKKEFEVDNLSKAFLYITSLGIYEAQINGVKVGNAILSPGSTDPRKRVQYYTYDVSNLLKEGHNEIIILLSDGWYRGSIGAKGFTYVFGEYTEVLAQLKFLPLKGKLE